ncbi:MAG: GntR family transcriptional regulator [Treponema sp.]|nr:GntR family transcriptional regulator [Spirochaetia bacterium]MDD7015125.1 GntR family transcriptional regulator [Spirochaetales bacterium]MDY4902209.1 GntR family transcriptional regulator [Treponema sp.]
MENTNSSTDLSASIFETLKEEILNLTIMPGQEIVESKICDRFSVTRPPVRTALRRLSDMGLVEIKPYYGTHATLLNMDKIFQIIHMRIIVESNVIQEFIASNPDAFILEELEHNIRLQNILISQPDIERTKFFELDNQLHSFWFTNQHCENIWDIIQEQKIEYTRFRMLDYESTMEYPEMIQDHIDLVDAIKKKDSNSIPVIIGEHLNNGVKRMGDKIFHEFSQYIIPPKNTEYWENYNKRYYK